jgi:hypothetical protein
MDYRVRSFHRIKWKRNVYLPCINGGSLNKQIQEADTQASASLKGSYQSNSKATRLPLHPQTNLPTRRSTNNPVLTMVEDSHGRNSGYKTIATQLSELLSFSTIYVDKTVHISDTETLNGVLWGELPLGTETAKEEEGEYGF